MRVMGRSWVWNESSETPQRELPLIIHRYNNPTYLEEDLRLNTAYPIVTLEHYFARSAFLLGMHASKTAKLLIQNATPVERVELRRYRWGDDRLAISSGFAGLLFAMQACRSVTVYGFDLTGSSPGHYFDDTSEGVVAKLQEILVREPGRKQSLSIDPGIDGVSFSSPSNLLEQEKARHASQAHVYRAWIKQQYASSTPSHPYVLERGVLRMFAEHGCIELGGRTSDSAS